jgi:hypothetical protein
METQKNTFDYLGQEFQIKLISNIIKDKEFGKRIIDIISPKYFNDIISITIISTIINEWEEKDTIIDVDDLLIRIIKENNNIFFIKTISNYVKKIKESSLDDKEIIQEKAILFCKHKELIKSVSEVKKILDKYDNIEEYICCEKILIRTLRYGK